MKKHLINSAFILCMTTLGLVGCKSVAEDNIHDTRRELSRAGFKKFEADTPEKLAHLKTLPQLEVTSRHRDGKLFFFYADSIYSKTLYVGREANYQKYEGIDIHQNTAELHHQDAVNEAVDLNMLATDSWGVWGPWGW